MLTSTAVVSTVCLLVVGCTARRSSGAVFRTRADRAGGETVQIEPWGRDSLRIRISFGGNPIVDGLPGALTEPPAHLNQVYRSEDNRTVTNGNIAAHIGDDNLLTFTRLSDSAVVLKEAARNATPSKTFTIRPDHTDKLCLTLFGEGLVSAPCTFEKMNQLFHLEDNLEFGRLVVAGRGRCLSVKGGNVQPHRCDLRGDHLSWTDGQLRTSGGLCLMTSQNGVIPCASSSREAQSKWLLHGEDDVLMTIGETFFRGPSDKLYGFGEHQNGALDQSGKKYDMESCEEYSHSHGSEECMPWIISTEKSSSSTGGIVNYGFLWNMPNFGSVDFGYGNGNISGIEWVAYTGTQVDYFVTVISSDAVKNRTLMGRDVMSNYVDAVGHALMLPEWAAGYWHSKNRYSSQKDLLAAAEEFHSRGIPVDIIVIDWKHWKIMGDWAFDPSAWPDPATMVSTLNKLGMRVMVSVWPFSTEKSTSHDTIVDNNYCVDNGTDKKCIQWPDGTCGGPCVLYDPSQDAARKYVWSRVKQGYYDYNIKVYWLDAAEPETSGGSPPGSHYSIGYATSVGMMFPYWHSRMIYEGMRSLGEDNVLLLARSSWVGAQRWGAAVWSGDIHSNFDVLKNSIQAGLSIQLSGIAWWTTDIGGYSGGNPSDPVFNELIVRWFQFGATCPLFRQHGARPTEPWLLSNNSYNIVVDTIKMRNTMRSYVLSQMKAVNETGIPVNRPLWFEFPCDDNAWNVTDQYMFGSDYMAAPVYTYQARNRSVYFPKASSWQHFFTNKTYTGGQIVTIDAPLEHFPLFKRMQFSIGCE